MVCHPHPLYGGDMENPLVVRAAEVCRRARLATLRFNFRGVGKSGGIHVEGNGERTTLLLLAGSRDPYCPRQALERLAAGIPGASLTVIEEADHFFFGKLYPLGEAVAAWTRRFSAAPPANAGGGGSPR